VDGGEDDAPGLDRELRPQIRPALGLHRRLAQELPAAGKGGEELVVQVVAVGEDDQRRVSHRRLADDAPRVESHGQALARALRVPDHADAPVARSAAGLAAGFIPAGPFRHEVRLALELGRA